MNSTKSDLENAKPPKADIEDSVKRALDEDVKTGDVTASLICETSRCKAEVTCRQNSVLCGTDWVNETFKSLDSSLLIEWMSEDGDHLREGQVVFKIEGNTRAILTGERTAINFLQTLSGTATITAQYVEKIKNRKMKVLDTRKTVPGLRSAQKYAVVCGGGKNHRKGLFDGVLIKENHIKAAGSVATAIRKMRKKRPDLTIEVEVENVKEISEALEARADIILLDNFNEEELATILPIESQDTKVEISGNINLGKISKLSELGIDYISVGALTKNIQAIDFSLKLI